MTERERERVENQRMKIFSNNICCMETILALHHFFPSRIDFECRLHTEKFISFYWYDEVLSVALKHHRGAFWYILIIIRVCLYNVCVQCVSLLWRLPAVFFVRRYECLPNRIWWRMELVANSSTYICLNIGSAVRVVVAAVVVATVTATATTVAAAAHFYYWPMYRPLICIVFTSAFFTLFRSNFKHSSFWTLVDSINQKGSTHTRTCTNMSKKK